MGGPQDCCITGASRTQQFQAVARESPSAPSTSALHVCFTGSSLHTAIRIRRALLALAQERSPLRAGVCVPTWPLVATQQLQRDWGTLGAS
jgi:hypothetical protein